MKASFILYVTDQQSSASFYSEVLDRRPTLDVPGMTEFTLSSGVTLGLMPAAGISRLLGDVLPAPTPGSDSAKAELYLVVDDAAVHHARALARGALELSPLSLRSWGDEVAYSLDPDGHVLAFAQTR